ncbi:MAG: homocysteine S-methyltransferase family protein [Kiritimatiellia bacterium]|nr:homocysteine S-methyltransferase family protein [Kiritimatiellia bacterium]
MSEFLSAIKSRVLLTDGAMGSFLFELTGRLSEANHVYESFQVDQPGLIQKVHLAYLGAGAQCLKTNTFGANRVQLGLYGLAHRTAELNEAGVRAARAAIAEFGAKKTPAERFFVLGSIGPTQPLLNDEAAVAESYREQVESLAAAGADALLLETFDSLSQLEQVIRLIRSRPGMPPIIAELTRLAAPGAGTTTDPDPAAFLGRMAELGVPVAGVNCCAPWDATAFAEAAVSCEPVRRGIVQLAVMPNAGGFQRIGNRFMTSVNPEFVGRMARYFMDRGVRLIGGCCEMHPPHIREMRNYLRSRKADAASIAVSRAALASVGKTEKRENGSLSRKIIDGKFAVSVEMLPPRGTDDRVVESRMEFIRRLAESGLADAVDITDGSRGIPLMSPGDFIHQIRARLGWTEKTGDALEMIPHFTGRDLNTLGIQSRLIGYHFHRIHNVLFITGDPPKMSPTYPKSTAVFDADSVTMIRWAATHLNAGVDFGGAPLGKQADPRTHFTVGAGFDPEAPAATRERRRLEQKLESGADYLMTQPAFRHEPLDLLGPFRSRIPILVGVMVLTSMDQAQRVSQIPGMSVPDRILARFAAGPTAADQARIGRELAIEQIQWVVREGWSGLYLMCPSFSPGILDVLREGLA